MPRPNAFIWFGVDVKPGGGSLERGATAELIRSPSIIFVQLLILEKTKYKVKIILKWLANATFFAKKNLMFKRRKN